MWKCWITWHVNVAWWWWGIGQDNNIASWKYSVIRICFVLNNMSPTLHIVLCCNVLLLLVPLFPERFRVFSCCRAILWWWLLQPEDGWTGILEQGSKWQWSHHCHEPWNLDILYLTCEADLELKLAPVFNNSNFWQKGLMVLYHTQKTTWI